MKYLNEKTRGSVVLIVVFSMVSLLGMGALVLDGGQLYFEAAKLQTAVDAAALAGARGLANGVAAAESAALTLAQQNGASRDELTISVNSQTNQVSVSATRTVMFGLARVLGFASAPVSASASAGTYSISGMSGIAPIGVIWQDFVIGTQYNLKVGSGGDTGNYGALALGGKGAANYRDNLMYGYDSMIRVDDHISTEPGNMAGPTGAAITWRLAQCTQGCTFENHIFGCTRILVVPVIDALPNGRGEVTVLGFASFFVESYLGDAYVRGRFLYMNAQGELGSAGNYGLQAIKLSN